MEGKLLERILRNKMYMHLEKQWLMRHSQHSFVHGRSWLINLIESFEEVTKKINEGSRYSLYGLKQGLS